MPFILTETDGAGKMSMNGGGGTMKGGFGSGGFGSGGYRMNGGGHFYNHMEMSSMDQAMSRQFGMRDGFSTVDSGMAIGEDFLDNYYSNVSGDILESTHKNRH